MTIFCALCSAGHVINAETTKKCPTCHRETVWRTQPQPVADATGDPGDEHRMFTEKDYRLLRSYRIAPD